MTSNKPENYYHATRGDILSLVPEGVTNVLEVGCRAGSPGLALKKKFACKVTGIEIVAEQARWPAKKSALYLTSL